VTNGELLSDSSAHLEMYPVEVRDGEVHLKIPVVRRDEIQVSIVETQPASIPEAGDSPPASEDLPPKSGDSPPKSGDLPPQSGDSPTAKPFLQLNEFSTSAIKPGRIGLVEVEDELVAVYNVNGSYYATQNACTHAEGPLDEGELNGKIAICPWHGSCFDVTSGAVTCGPAKDPLRTYRVEVDGAVGRVFSIPE
jgi:nitrite reductase/ring-hydroxylating ferredoxin subunit